jgi:cyclophilin family peptidyl-prolyl cis-trans isomerase
MGPTGFPPQPPALFGQTMGPGGSMSNTLVFENRASTVLTLGIVSLALLFFCAPATFILGPLAIILGFKLRSDTVRAGVPEPSRNKTGWILGIVSTSLLLLGIVAFFAFASIGRSSTTRINNGLGGGAATTVARFPTPSVGTAKPSTPPSSISEFAPSTQPGRTLSKPTPCPNADGTDARVTTFASPPPMCIDPAKEYTAVVTTNKGVLNITLDASYAPKTVNNFVVLARYHFFDNTLCHRIVPGFVIQCGDPTGTGTGGPGYTFADELPEDGDYVIGSVAMANSGPDTNTNGSQFFIISGDHGAALPPKYSLFGEVDSDQDQVVADLDAAGSLRGTPTKELVYIESVDIIES